MALGRKTGGRVKGQPNKDKKAVLEQLAQLKCNPIEGLARIAVKAEADGELAVAVRCYGELAGYCHPKLRAVEVSADPEERISFNLTMGKQLALSESLQEIVDAAEKENARRASCPHCGPAIKRPVSTDERAT